MAELALFPDDCQALIIEPEPIQAMTLECLLEEFGCRRMGPAATLVDVEKLLDARRPSFALVAADLADELEPVTAVLDHERIPFALLAVGPDNAVLDKSRKLRSRARVRRPYHAPSLHTAMCTLYRDNLSGAITTADSHIKQGQKRLAWQLRLIEELAAKGQDTAQADALAREYGRLLRTMRTSRAILARRLTMFAGWREHA
ncbi:MAG: hypothetical protein AB7O95_18775 [Geminicoccaceae bacterium]